MAADHELGGVPVRVVELTGRAGDIVIGHPWLLHAPAPNCGTTPRFMTVQRVKAAAGDKPRSLSARRGAVRPRAVLPSAEAPGNAWRD